ncbi:MAG TPA: hypothetical protein EYN66_22320, partial [Myxococcales bacterium]|nr:hypothetical protein [Myxococcales bacterium]
MPTTLKEPERSKYHGANNGEEAESTSSAGALETTLAKSTKPTPTPNDDASTAFVYAGPLAH